MSKLIIYKKNGGEIYDIVMAQKLKEKKARKFKIEKELAKEVRNLSSSRYANSWNSSLPVLAIGK